MRIGSTALKVLRLIPRYAFSNGTSVISKARKSVITPGTKSIFGKNNEFALKNSRSKIEAGWDALKKDALKTMNSKKGVWASIKSFGKALVTKPKQGIRVVEKLAARAGKTAGFWAKTGGALKGLGKALGKLPIVGTIIAVGCEVPDIYDAFNRGGIWEGTKQIFKSTAKIAAFAAGTALGAVIAGPVGAMAGGLIADIIVGKLVGGSYSENHPKEETEAETKGATPQENVSSKTSEQNADSSASSSASTSDTSTNSQRVSSSTDAGATVTDINSSVSGQSNPFGASLNVPNPVFLGMNPSINFGSQFGTGLGMSPMIGGMGFGISNPFVMPTLGLGNGLGIGASNPFTGCLVNTYSPFNSFLQPEENIFLKYPMGYQFQYMGH